MSGRNGRGGHKRATMLWTAAAAIGTTLPGCYTYTPTTAELAPVGENVRVYIARDDAPELIAATGTEDLVPQVRGRVEGLEGGSLLVRVPLRRDGQPGLSTLDIGQLVRVPTDEILSLEQQHFSPGRTTALVGGAVAAAAFILYVVIDARNGDDTIGDPDPDILFQGIRIPIG